MIMFAAEKKLKEGTESPLFLLSHGSKRQNNRMDYAIHQRAQLVFGGCKNSGRQESRGFC
jgi:hypothetical protein